MIEVADKGPPMFEMGIFENSYGIVVVKAAAEGSEIDGHDGRAENDRQCKWTDP